MDAGTRTAQIRYIATTGRAVCCPTGLKDVLQGTGILVTSDPAAGTRTVSNNGVLSTFGLRGVVDMSAGTGIQIATAGQSITVTNTNPNTPIMKVLTQNQDISFNSTVKTIFDVSSGTLYDAGLLTSITLPTISTGVVSAIANIVYTDASTNDTLDGVLYINDVSAATISSYMSASGSLTIMGMRMGLPAGIVPIRLTLKNTSGLTSTVRSIQVQLLGNIASG